MPSQDVTSRIDRVKAALNEKGFGDVYPTHYDDTPSRLIVLHDDHGRVAHCEDEELVRMIGESDDLPGLWSALEGSGLSRKAAARA